MVLMDGQTYGRSNLWMVKLMDGQIYGPRGLQACKHNLALIGKWGGLQ